MTKTVLSIWVTIISALTIIGLCCFIIIFLSTQKVKYTSSTTKGIIEPQIEIPIEGPDLWRKHNEERILNGVATLRWSPELEDQTCNRVQDMAKTDVFDHIKFHEMVPEDPYFYGENLSKNFTDEDKLMKAWMDSESHRKNVLNPRFHYMGLCKMEEYVVVWFRN